MSPQVIPATPESLTDVDEVQGKPEPVGLQRGWMIGEKIPWKGIVFQVCGVTRDRLMLAPIDETAKHKKKRIGRGA